MLGVSNTTVNSYGTFIFSTLSLIGSCLVIFSYCIARTSSKPRAARLILNLAIADFIWFLTSFIESSVWVLGGTPGHVPADLCYVCSPLVNLGRLSSLLWTSVVAFEVLQSVKKSKWATEVEKSEYYDISYFIIIYVLSSPAAIFNIYKQHETQNNENLGCDPGYESIGKWYVVLFTELIPIMLGFTFNVFVFSEVHRRMSTRKYPQSVRKRRKRVMYHYLLVCIICWLPTIIHYGFELAHISSNVLQIVSRCSLYSTGFLNFLVFGMQDPHLKRSFRRSLEFCGLVCCLSSTTTLKQNPVEKTVMFEYGEKTNADIAKDKKFVYRNNRLSRDDKLFLFSMRPDLDLRNKNEVEEPLLTSEQPRQRQTKIMVHEDSTSNVSGNKKMRLRSSDIKVPSRAHHMTDEDDEEANIANTNTALEAAMTYFDGNSNNSDDDDSDVNDVKKGVQYEDESSSGKMQSPAKAIQFLQYHDQNTTEVDHHHHHHVEEEGEDEDLNKEFLADDYDENNVSSSDEEDEEDLEIEDATTGG